jgi:hypothetical protein
MQYEFFFESNKSHFTLIQSNGIASTYGKWLQGSLLLFGVIVLSSIRQGQGYQ